MYNWDVIQPPESSAWNVLGLLEYEVDPSPWAIVASIPNYDDMGNPNGTYTTKTIASAIQTRAMIEDKFFTYKFLTGLYYSYKDQTYKPMVQDAEHAYYKFLTAWGNYKQGMQIWIDKIAQALYILDNPADNYNKRIHSIMTYNGSEKNEMNPTGSETITSTKSGKQKETLTKSGKETSEFNKGAEEYKSYRTTMNSNDPKLTDKNETVATLPNNVAYKDSTTTTYGGNNDNDKRKDVSEIEYTNVKDAVTKAFADRKDTDTKTFLDRYDDYVMREWGNIGVTTYAQILTGILGIASDADLFDFIMHDFFNKTCVVA